MLPRALAATMGLLLILPPQLAVGETSFETRGRIYLSFEPDRVVTDRTAQPFERFDVYVLMQFDDPQSLPDMYVAQTGLRFDDSIAFSSYEILDPGENVLHGLDPGFLQITLFWFPCLSPPTGLHPILRLHAILQNHTTNALIGIEAVPEDPTFGGQGPGWSDCAFDVLYLFGSDPVVGSTLTLNRTVATDVVSWTRVKSTFDGKERP
jgi:hypothetical protein